MRRDDFESAITLLNEQGIERLERSLSGANDQVQLLREDILRAERALFEKIGRARWSLTGQRERANVIRTTEIPYQTQEFNLVGTRAPLVQSLIGRRIKALGNEADRLDGLAKFRLRQVRREARVVLALEGQTGALEESYELISIAIDMGYHLIQAGYNVNPLDEAALKELSRAYPVND